VRREAAALLAGVCLLWTPEAAATEQRGGPVGWGAATTGGAGGTAWTVHTRAELKEALANGGDPTTPKVIRVVGAVNGHEADDVGALDPSSPPTAYGWPTTSCAPSGAPAAPRSVRT
jgi:pectate lyase